LKGNTIVRQKIELGIIGRIKYNPLSAAVYRRYFIRRALRTGEPELHALLLLAPRDRLAIDIGSNKGVFSYILTDLGISTHAFEPQPFFYERLNRTAPCNLTCHNIALSNQEGEQDFYLPTENGRVLNQIASLHDLSSDFNCETIWVQTRRLDDMKLENVGFIKIDVEGWEREVLEGGLDTIRRDKPNMLIEIEENHTGELLWDSLKFIESLGYSTHSFHEGKIQPLDAFFDIERHHRSPGSDRYYNNFIFLPT